MNIGDTQLILPWILFGAALLIVHGAGKDSIRLTIGLMLALCLIILPLTVIIELLAKIAGKLN